MIKANRPNLQSWVDVPENSDFPIQNLPFGIFQTASTGPRLCSAIGNQVIDLFKLSQLGFFTDLQIERSIFENRYLNDFMALGKAKTSALRNRLSDLLELDNSQWNAKEHAEHFLHPMTAV
ncbi:MAG: fumarylacetoacetase, partial [Bacteroidota bacterium]